MADVLSNYRPGAAYDEMIDAEGDVRPSYQAIHNSLSRSSPTELRHIADSLASNYTQAGVTFDVGGVERPFPLDLVPRVIAAAEWGTIEAGVAQRVKALEAFLADVYAGARVIADGVVPSQLITSSTHFHRAVWGIEPANGVRVHVAGVDLIRNPDGDVRVLEDNVRVPSGVSYVMTNRSAMITALPGAFANQRIRPVAGYPTRLLAALRKCAPSGVDDPTVVVLTPGVYNSAYFEHTLLARTMGVELVEGRDLECRRGKVYMRTTAGPQRVRALEAFLADIYADARVITDGVIPSQLVTSSTHFHRAVWGIKPGNGVRIHVAGVDLVRNPAGDVRVLEDNVRAPSGVSYVMTNRNAMITAMPEAFANQRIRPVASYPTRLLTALRKAAPPGVDEPTVVVLTPGVYNSAYFEHTLLARTMGVELVEGRDLECRRGKVFMRTTAGLQRVDVIYRRIDDEFLDPVHFRSDSMLGVPGLVNAIRTGGVALANAIGNGVADDKLIYTYVPDLIKYYMREDPIIANIDTWRLEEEEAREEVLDRLRELVVKPVDGSGGKGIVIGPRATEAELDALRRRVIEDPRGWIAQPVVQLSTVPTLIEDGLKPRHVDLRPFAVNNGEDVWV
ncbi:MAG TPA: circularly permuted type 2 ATP-grasp protein, partial [Propionibacteriaceae bacterium]|nr:circularly permuted type 2 ATP-grasp protein [Propionibacteriaceae bacterium]